MMTRYLNHRWPWLIAIIPVGLAVGAFFAELTAISWAVPGAILIAVSLALAIATTPMPGGD